MSITFPPEMLPRADGPSEVIVENSDGSRRVVWRSDFGFYVDQLRNGRWAIFEPDGNRYEAKTYATEEDAQRASRELLPQ